VKADGAGRCRMKLVNSDVEVKVRRIEKLVGVLILRFVGEAHSWWKA